MGAYSKTQVNKAGGILKDELQFSALDVNEAENILTYWRYIHAPVINTFQATLRTKIARKYNKRGFIAQRLKRVSSIIAKLQREKHMKLSTMQDIAGIRAIMNDLGDVQSLSQELQTSTTKHNLLSANDYIQNPKKSGYRSIHLIFEYINANTPNSNGLKIEVQVRTQLQHTWATAVETMGTFLSQPLKASEGDKEILDFLSLASSAFAIIEGTPILSEHKLMPQSQILSKVVEVYDHLSIKDKLTAYTVVTTHTTRRTSKAYYYLFTLDLDLKTLMIHEYPQTDIEKANIDYTNKERSISQGKNLQVVLISVDKISALYKAYPNYLLDANDFMDKIEMIRGATNLT